MVSKRPSKPNLPFILSPPSFYSNKASRNHVLSSSPDPATSSMLHLPFQASSNASQQHQISLDTLKGCGKCLGYQPLNGMEMVEMER